MDYSTPVCLCEEHGESTDPFRKNIANQKRWLGLNIDRRLPALSIELQITFQRYLSALSVVHLSASSY